MRFLLFFVNPLEIKALPKIHFPISGDIESTTETETLTYEEKNRLCYAAGYVPRTLKEKKQLNAHKRDLLSCLPNFLDKGEDLDDESNDWNKAINRGGLIKINNDTYELLVAMELELYKHLSSKEITILQGY